MSFPVQCRSKYYSGTADLGMQQSFLVNIPIEYRLPSFSPVWDDYSHDTVSGKTVVMTDTSDKSQICVYSAAQLQLLWQSVFVQGLQHDVCSTTESIENKKFKISVNTFNTLLYTYPYMDHIPADNVPDLANLSNYWVVNPDKSIDIQPLCYVEAQGSRMETAPYDYKTSLQCDPALAKLAAKAYGIKPDIAETFSSLIQVGEYLRNKGLVKQNYRFDNVFFPPATIVSPEWYQMPLNGYYQTRSPLSVLIPLCDSIQISELHLDVSNSGNSTYTPVIRMAIFKSPTTSVQKAMQNTENAGTYSVQILSTGGQRFDLYSRAGKEIVCTPTFNDYALNNAAASWGYNLVVHTDIRFKNFYNSVNSSNEYRNKLLTVWCGTIRYVASCRCLQPLLPQISFDEMLKELYLKQLVSAEESSSSGKTVGAPANVATTESTYYRSLVARATRLSDQHKIRLLGKKTTLRTDSTANDLHPYIDYVAMNVLKDQTSYPFQQAADLAGCEGLPHMLSHYAVTGQPNDVTPLSETPTLSDASVLTPLCPQGGNCYNRRGICINPRNENKKCVVSEYRVNNTVQAGSSFTTTIALDEMYAANTIQVNKENLDNISAQMQEAGVDTVYTGQALAAVEPPAGTDDAVSPGAAIATNGDGFLDFIKKAAAVVTNLFHSGDENALTTRLYKGYASNTNQFKNQTLESGRLTGKENETAVQFITSNIYIPSDFVPAGNPVSNNIDQWPEDFRSVITNYHPGILEIPYILKIAEEQDLSACTPGQVVINKSEVTNINASLGTTYANVNDLPPDARSNQCPCDHFKCQTTNRAFAILNSEPFQSANWSKTAVICSKPYGFLVAPAPVTISQLSAANSSSAASIYGSASITEGNRSYLFFNSVLITSINDLSGTLPFYLPSKIPVMEGTEVQMVPIADYVGSGKQIYITVYNMVEMSVTAQLGSSLLKSPDLAEQDFCMLLWNYDRPSAEENRIPIKVASMPVIPASDGWSNCGKVAKVSSSPQADLPILCKYFYMVTDKQNVPVTSNTASSTNMQFAKKTRLRKSGDSYAIKKEIEKKLPGHLRVEVLGV